MSKSINSTSNSDKDGIAFYKDLDVGELGMSTSLTLDPGPESIGNLNKSMAIVDNNGSPGSHKNEVADDMDIDIHSDSSGFSVDSEAAGATERKSRYFEFSDSIAFLRVIKLFSVLHIISIGVENQATQDEYLCHH